MISVYKKHGNQVFSLYGIADLAIFFCLFSVIGHLIEFPYVMIGDYFFHAIPEDFGVGGYPLEPFVIYGVTACFINIFIVPIGLFLKKLNHNNKFIALFWMYIIGVVIAIVFETGMGLIFNQPVDGVYPMWDNSQMPGNILEQGGIVNDLCYGLLIIAYVNFIYPLFQHKILDKIPKKPKLIITGIIIVLSLINVYITYGIFHE